MLFFCCLSFCRIRQDGGWVLPLSLSSLQLCWSLCLAMKTQPGGCWESKKRERERRLFFLSFSSLFLSHLQSWLEEEEEEAGEKERGAGDGEEREALFPQSLVRYLAALHPLSILTSSESIPQYSIPHTPILHFLYPKLHSFPHTLIFHSTDGEGCEEAMYCIRSGLRFVEKMKRETAEDR